jgi:hypothetical protein
MQGRTTKERQKPPEGEEEDKEQGMMGREGEKGRGIRTETGRGIKRRQTQFHLGNTGDEKKERLMKPEMNLEG